jgi:hypothetical protein
VSSYGVPRKHLQVVNLVRTSVRRPASPPRATDHALLRAAVGLPPGAPLVVRTSADPATYPTHDPRPTT